MKRSPCSTRMIALATHVSAPSSKGTPFALLSPSPRGNERRASASEAAPPALADAKAPRNPSEPEQRSNLLSPGGGPHAA